MWKFNKYKDRNMTVSILPEFLTANETELLLSYFDDQPYTCENTVEYNSNMIVENRHKNNDYNVPNSLCQGIIYPKLEKIIGLHIMDSGSFLESHYPFGIHVDSKKTFADDKFYSHVDSSLNISVLISLNEDPGFNTVMFDYFAEIVDYDQVPSTRSLSNTIADPKYADLNFDHFTPQELKFVRNLQITNVYKWKTGSVIMWPRNQLHASSNFYASGKQKKAIVLFL